MEGEGGADGAGGGSQPSPQLHSRTQAPPPRGEAPASGWKRSLRGDGAQSPKRSGSRFQLDSICAPGLHEGGLHPRPEFSTLVRTLDTRVVGKVGEERDVTP